MPTGAECGCSERNTPENVWPLETLLDDIGVVLDACGAERAAVLATDHMGFVASMFAATYPDRVEARCCYEVSAN